MALQNGPAVSLYLTLFGIVASFVSTFWSFGYTRLSRRLRGYLQVWRRPARVCGLLLATGNPTSECLKTSVNMWCDA